MRVNYLNHCTNLTHSVAASFLCLYNNSLCVVGLYGSLFKSSSGSAFSHFRIWESTGYMLAFGYQSHLCLPVKAYILLAVLCFSIICYSIIEYVEWRNGKSDRTE